MQLVDESVDLVDEENRLHLLLEGLADNGFCLWHGSLNRTGEDETTVNSTHGASHVTAKVNVTWRVNEVDEEVRTLNGVNH